MPSSDVVKAPPVAVSAAWQDGPKNQKVLVLLALLLWGAGMTTSALCLGFFLSRLLRAG